MKQLGLILEELQSIGARLENIETRLNGLDARHDTLEDLLGQTNLAAGKLHQALEARNEDHESQIARLDERVAGVEKKTRATG